MFKESNNDFEDISVNSFLANLFICIGEYKYSNILLNKINNISTDDLDVKAHILKLEGHFLFNEEKLFQAKKKYIESLDIFKKNNSKYIAEISFYLAIIDIINDENESDYVNITNNDSFEDDYFELIYNL